MYSSCSKTNMWWLKNCCSFSLQKLMQICSNPLYSKISNPAMSKTPMKQILQKKRKKNSYNFKICHWNNISYLLIEGSTKVSLHLETKYRNCLSKIALAIAATALWACWAFWPWKQEKNKSPAILVKALWKTLSSKGPCFLAFSYNVRKVLSYTTQNPT